MGEVVLAPSVELDLSLPGPQHCGAGRVVDIRELALHCSPPHGSPQLMASGMDAGRKRLILLWGPQHENLIMLQLIYRPHKMDLFFGGRALVIGATGEGVQTQEDWEISESGCMI